MKLGGKRFKPEKLMPENSDIILPWKNQISIDKCPFNQRNN